MKIGIIIAMDKEFRRISELLDNLTVEESGGRSFTLGNLSGNDIVLHQCGIGKVNAAIGTTELIRRYSPQLVISTGCAGGGQTSMEVQDVVVSTQLAYHDVYCGSAIGHTVYGQVQGMPARYQSPSSLVDAALSLNGDGQPRIYAGLIVTGDWFVDSRDKMRAIMSHFPEAVAVDMESAAIAQTCHVYGIDFISFRVISDIPLKDTNASQYHNFWDTIADHSFATTRRFLAKL
ncbi:MAG: 5'-methylthioadenosine/adenosylhomocysteine nucleosidase [Prevotellaceae bacterium]|nr:5'-methylthioadenosine/adenosylhomocysteine nucleosidase [Prevotellaceae bacterium]